MELNEKLWDFPCQVPLKIMGPAEAPLQSAVEAIILTHVPDFDLSTLSIRLSRSGKYQSITVNVYITQKEQILGIYEKLAQHQENTNDISLVL